MAVGIRDVAQSCGVEEETAVVEMDDLWAFRFEEKKIIHQAAIVGTTEGVNVIIGFEFGVALGQKVYCSLEPSVGYVVIVGLWTLQGAD